MNPLAAEVLFIGIRKEGKMLESLVKKESPRWSGRDLSQRQKKLAKTGVSERKIREFGFEYSNTLAFIDGEIGSKSELIDKIVKSTLDYAKRQMTWFGKDSRIIWIRNRQEAIIKINKFLIL